MTALGGTGTKAAAYTYVTAPTVTTVAPVKGSHAGGTPVTITGTNLTTTTKVTFGGSLATTVHVTSATKVTAKTASHTAGAVTVKVTALGGTGTKAAAYTLP